MKHSQTLKTKVINTGKVYLGMSDEMKEALNGKTINEALQQGLIDDLGDDVGNLLDSDANGDYAIIQGCAVVIGPSIKALEETLSEEEFSLMAGNFQFRQATSTIEGDGFGKKFFRLQYGTGGRKSTNARGNVFAGQTEEEKTKEGVNNG